MVSSPFFTGVVMRHDGDVVSNHQKEGEDHEQDYNDWAGFGKRCVSCGVL
jgi:hypothetical protein